MDDLIWLSHSISPFAICGEGNVSSRTDKGFLIKASGYDLKTITQNQFVECDFNGEPLNRFDKNPSIETSFHSFLYQFPEVNFIAHSHPSNVLKILCSKFAKDFSKTRLFPDQVVRNGVKSCFVPYKTPGESLKTELGFQVCYYYCKYGYVPQVILLQNHGLITTGKSAKEAYYATMMCEKAADIYIGSKLLGQTKLSKTNIKDLTEMPQENYRRNIIK